MHKRSAGIGILIVLLPFFLIDGVNLVGKIYNPEILNNFVCVIFPYLKISDLLLPHQLIEYAGDQCSKKPQEPTISIIFLMFKITIILILSLGLGLKGAWVNIIRIGKQKKYLTTNYIKIIKDNSSTALVLLLFCFVIFHQLNKSSNYFGINLISKIKEDFMCIVALAAFTMFVGSFQLVVFLAYNQTRLLMRGKTK